MAWTQQKTKAEAKTSTHHQKRTETATTTFWSVSAQTKKPPCRAAFCRICQCSNLSAAAIAESPTRAPQTNRTAIGIRTMAAVMEESLGAGMMDGSEKMSAQDGGRSGENKCLHC